MDPKMQRLMETAMMLNKEQDNSDQEFEFDENDPELKEVFKNMSMFDDFVKGSEFERKLDAFLDKAMADGRDPEDIL
jgi:hypothetical protein